MPARSDPHHAAGKRVGISLRSQTNVIECAYLASEGQIDKGFEAPLLHTVRGAGYMIRAH